MNASSRKQFLDLVTRFKLATEANKEALAQEYDERMRRELSAKHPVTSTLEFCMERAGTVERAEAIFNHVLKTSRISYWPEPRLPSHLQKDLELKRICFEYFVVPIKATPTFLLVCGCNQYDVDGPTAIWKRLAGATPAFPVVVLSEPERMRKALAQFAQT
jgi:hypothetical protein